MLAIDGRRAKWPEALHALPPPIGASDAPLPFALRYRGRANFHDAASLQLRHEDTRFDARFRLPEVTAWMSSIAHGSPLPPLSGHLSTPPLEISGAPLEGVDVTIQDPSPPSEDAPVPVISPTTTSPPPPLPRSTTLP